MPPVSRIRFDSCHLSHVYSRPCRIKIHEITAGWDWSCRISRRGFVFWAFQHSESLSFSLVSFVSPLEIWKKKLTNGLLVCSYSAPKNWLFVEIRDSCTVTVFFLSVKILSRLFFTGLWNVVSKHTWSCCIPWEIKKNPTFQGPKAQASNPRKLS